MGLTLQTASEFRVLCCVSTLDTVVIHIVPTRLITRRRMPASMSCDPNTQFKALPGLGISGKVACWKLVKFRFGVMHTRKYSGTIRQLLQLGYVLVDLEAVGDVVGDETGGLASRF